MIEADGKDRMGKRNGNLAGAKVNSNNVVRSTASANNGAVKESDDGQDPGMADYLRKKQELKMQQLAEEEEAKRKLQEENRKKAELDELPRDPEQEKRTFINELFGHDFPIDSRLLAEEFASGNKVE